LPLSRQYFLTHYPILANFPLVFGIFQELYIKGSETSPNQNTRLRRGFGAGAFRFLPRQGAGHPQEGE
jgi:hypothetical protein